MKMCDILEYMDQKHEDISASVRGMFEGTNLQIAQQKKADKGMVDSDQMRTAVPRDQSGRPILPPNGLTLDMPHGQDLHYHDEVAHTDMFCD